MRPMPWDQGVGPKVLGLPGGQDSGDFVAMPLERDGDVSNHFVQVHRV